MTPVVALVTKARSSGSAPTKVPTAARAASSAGSSCSTMKRTGSCSSCRRQVACASSTTRGAAPYEPWFRKSTRGSSGQWRACSDGIGGYRRPMDLPPSSRQRPGRSGPRPGRHAGRHGRDPDPGVAGRLRGVRYPGHARTAGADDRDRRQAAGPRRGRRRPAGRCPRAGTRRSTAAAARSTNRSTRIRRPCPAHESCSGGWTRRRGHGPSPPRHGGSRWERRWRRWTWGATRPSWTARPSRMPSPLRTCCWQLPPPCSSRRRTAGASAIRPGTCARPARPG